MGPFDRAAKIEIRWPSGRIQVLTSMTGDRVLTVTEQ
jgi:hypothetical protein